MAVPRAPAGFSQIRIGHSSKEQYSHVEMRWVLIEPQATCQMLVLATRTPWRDAWKPKQGFREELRGLYGTSHCVWGHPSAWMNAGS